MAIQRDKIIASAEKLVAKGKVEAAIKEYDRLLEDNPNDVNTLNRIGDLWVRINNTGEAVKVFGRIADHYSKDGFFLKAIAIYKKINKLDPSKLDVYAKLADLYAKQGLAMEAKSQYQVVADYYLKHGDPGNALATYRKISELDPNSINVHVKLADLYSQNNQTGEALKEYDRVGRMLLKRGMLDEAVQVFRKALKIDATNMELIESLVNALIDAKDYENATTILETSLEKNRENPRLITLLGKSQLGKNDLNGARTTLERGLSANPTDTGIRETLADVYLRMGQSDRALELVNPVVDSALARGEGRVAVDLLNRILKTDSAHIPTLTRLVAAYTKLREETNVLASMNTLAEAHISRRNFADAAQMLNELVKREPENRQHRDKLAFVQQQLSGGGGAAMPIEPPRFKPEPQIQINDDISIGLDDSEPMEIDLSTPAPPVAAPTPKPKPAPAPAPPPRPVAPAAPPAPVRPAAPVMEEDEGEADNLDFITEHLTEAEVFAKYGLAEKAIEHLRAILDRAPRHAAAHEKLLRVLMEEGDTAQIKEAANQYIALLREQGDETALEAIQKELVTRGFIDAPVEGAPPPRRAVAPPPVEVEELSAQEMMQPDLSPAPEEELTLEVESIEESNEIEFDVEEPPEFDTPVAVSPMESVEPAPEETFDIGEPTPQFEPPEYVEEELEVEPEPVAAASPVVEFTPEPQPGDFDFNETVRATPSDFDLDAPSIASPAPEELGEVDFYIEQDLIEEARSRLLALESRYPGSDELVERSRRIEELSARSELPSIDMSTMESPSFQNEEQSPQTFSADDIENELLSAIPEDDDDIEILAPKAPAASAASDEANLFAEEDDFFDLAAELEEELEEDADEKVSLSEEEQSLEEIFREFKRGVEQQLDSEDYDTHYNLGIAYKEMGLIDEAIGEFQLASKDPKRTIECCSMLGLCFLEKGMPQLAIKWYSKGLEVAEITQDEQLGLLYDLGNAYLEVGDVPLAQKAFVEIYGINSNYRDIVSRIKQLEDVSS